jgi:hypothetical protein
MKKYLGYVVAFLMLFGGTLPLFVAAQFGDTTYVADVGVP